MLQNTTTQTDSPIDVRELLDRCMDNIDLAERVLGKLNSRFADDMAELERALEAKNGHAVASVAHRLKGAAANVAAHDLQKYAADVEESARREMLDRLPAQFDLLRNEWKKINDTALTCLTPYRSANENTLDTFGTK
jgi:HPt (histidine-containing phosphotransfer) domain-containing protein